MPAKTVALDDGGPQEAAGETVVAALLALNARLSDEGRRRALLERLAKSPRGEWAMRYRKQFGWDVRQAHRVLDGACTCRDGQECGTPGKHPIGVWRESGRLPVGLVRRQWQAEPWANIALLTGRRSRLVVADLDNKPDKYPLSVRERLGVLQEHGWRLDTCIERSGGGGLHVYASIPEDVSVPSQSTYIEPGIEVLAEGRLVMIAPSRHASGRHYAWLKGHDPWTVPAAPLRPELVDLLREQAEPAHSAEPVELSEGELRGLARRAPGFVRSAVERARAGTDGGRHNTGVWLACQLRDLRVSDAVGRRCMLAYQKELEALHV